MKIKQAFTKAVKKLRGFLGTKHYWHMVAVMEVGIAGWNGVKVFNNDEGRAAVRECIKEKRTCTSEKFLLAHETHKDMGSIWSSGMYAILFAVLAQAEMGKAILKNRLKEDWDMTLKLLGEKTELRDKLQRAELELVELRPLKEEKVAEAALAEEAAKEKALKDAVQDALTLKEGVKLEKPLKLKKKQDPAGPG